MKVLKEAILEEKGQPYTPEKQQKCAFTPPGKARIARFNQVMDNLMRAHDRACVSFSGGSDSLVLLDLISHTPHKPIVIWADTQMEYPETQEFIETTVAGYGMELRIARAQHSPLEQWQRTGWPMLGKLGARLWMQRNRDKDFSINVSECCRAMKIRPARQLARNIGCTLQITGQRGSQDDLVRGLRGFKDGTIFYQKRDRLWIANPLSDWTESEILSYIAERRLQQHPSRYKGASTIGCVYCGGGSQHTNSGYRILRTTWPEAWQQFIVEWKGGLVILALKHGRRLSEIHAAVQELGGLGTLAKERPWVFDYTRKTPIPGYTK